MSHGYRLKAGMTKGIRVRRKQLFNSPWNRGLSVIGARAWRRASQE
ncbi:hypothetical protein [Solemya elarraichensis gill symbiont]|nr:hypothetical protein [Solemya elarraichensis gill symbiont]